MRGTTGALAGCRRLTSLRWRGRVRCQTLAGAYRWQAGAPVLSHIPVAVSHKFSEILLGLFLVTAGRLYVLVLLVGVGELGVIQAARTRTHPLARRMVNLEPTP